MATITIGGLTGKTPLATDEIEIQATAGGASNKATLAQVKTLMSDSPTLVTPNIGTPSAGVLTNATGLPTAGIVDAAVTLAKMADLAQDQMIVRTTASTGVPQTATVTAAARTVLDDATVAAMVDTLGGATSTGTGGLARATSPTFVTPVLGAATGTDFTATGQSYYINTGQTVSWKAGTGSPEGAVTAGIGSMWSQTDGTTNTSLWRKEAGTGNTGWVAVAAGAGGGDVSKVGTPANNQVGVWTGDGTIEGDAALAFDTTTDALTVGAGSITRAGAHVMTITTTGTTNVTFPTGGTVYTSGGTGADVAVTDGGTGRSTSTTAYGLIAAGTTATGAHQTLAAGATTEVLVGGGASSLPLWTTASGSGAPLRQTSPTITAPSISGISTSDGASITTANAMGALAIDVTKGLNTKTVATESTFTFSGTPATANTWFGMHVINSDTAPHILTFPSAFSQVTQAARTTCPIAASGQLYLLFRYDGSAYKVFGDAGFLNNYVATTAPAVTDDLDLGYGSGSLWLDATGNATYICESAANGAAVWHLLGGSGDMVLASVQTVTGAKTFGSAGAVGKLIVAGNTSGTTVIAAAAVAGTTTTTLPNANSTLPIYTQQITYAGPTAPRTITYPDAAITVARTDAAQTFTGVQTVAAGAGVAAVLRLAGNGTTPGTTSFDVQMDSASNVDIVNRSNTRMSFYTNGTERMQISAAGAVTVGGQTVGYIGLPQNSQSAAYTTVLADAGKHLYHPGADTTARTFTIDSNANVAYPIGTTLTFVNDTSAGVITIAITSDTMILAGAGTTGSRTLAANGIATAVKMTSTRWMINGTGLT